MGKKEAETVLRNYDHKLPKFDKNIDLYIQEAQPTPRRINMKIFTFRHAVVKLLDGNGKNLENSKKKNPTYTRNTQ